MSASTWQEEHAPVPFPESLASYKKPRPSLIFTGVGSVPTEISPDLAILEVSIIEMVLEIRFKEYRVWAGALRASPLGPRLCRGSAFAPDPPGPETSTNVDTVPLVST